MSSRTYYKELMKELDIPMVKMSRLEEYMEMARDLGIKKMKKKIAWATNRLEQDREGEKEALDKETEQPRLVHEEVIRELDDEIEIMRDRLRDATYTHEPKLESQQAELEEVNIGNLWNEEQSNIVQEELKPKDKTEGELNKDLKVTDTLECLKIDSLLNDTQVHENIIESCITSPSENGSQNDLISPSVNGSDDLISPSENGRNHDKLMMINESVNLISHNEENVPIADLLRKLESNYKEDILELKKKFNKEMEKLTQKFMCELESIKKHKEVKKDEKISTNYNVNKLQTDSKRNVSNYEYGHHVNKNAQNESKRNVANYEYSQHVNKNVINVINAQNERKRNLANYEYSHHVYKKPKSRCFYCGKTGHYQNQCWHRLANQRKNNYVHRKSCEKYSNLRNNVSSSNQNNKSVNRYTNGSYRRKTYYERPKQCHNIYIELVDEPNQHTQSKITTDVVQKPEENIKTNEVTQVTRNLGNDYGSTAKSYNLRERWHTGHRQLHENDYSCYRGC